MKKIALMPLLCLIAVSSAAAQLPPGQPPGEAKAPPAPAQATPPAARTAPTSECGTQLREIDDWIEVNPVNEANRHRRTVITRMRDRAAAACAQGSPALAMQKIGEVRQMLGLPPTASQTTQSPEPPRPETRRPAKIPVD